MTIKTLILKEAISLSFSVMEFICTCTTGSVLLSVLLDFTEGKKSDRFKIKG